MRPPPNMNPPPVVFNVPYVAVAVVVIVNTNGVLPDGTNPGTPDTTTPLVLTPIAGGTFVTATIDPTNNRRIIVTGVPPAPAQNSVQPWSFKVSVPSKPAFVTISGTTAAPTDVAGVTWDGNPVGPA